MGVPRFVVLSAVLVFSGAGTAVAAESVQPRANVLLGGEIKFPRAQSMYIKTGRKDSSRLTVALGFHGKCKGGKLSELWSSNVVAKPRLRVRDGRFDGTLTGVTRNVGGVAGRTGHFKWTFKGRFTGRTVAIGKVSGTADVRVGGKRVSTCKTGKPASVRLTRRAA